MMIYILASPSLLTTLPPLIDVEDFLERHLNSESLLSNSPIDLFNSNYMTLIEIYIEIDFMFFYIDPSISSKENDLCKYKQIVKIIALYLSLFSADAKYTCKICGRTK
jgi:hypothetical protein